MNHIDQVAKRIYSQYRDKPKLLAWLYIIASLANQIEGVYSKVAGSYLIDDASGEQLNVIGRVVGISRNYDGGVMDDDTYRLILKARIAKNVSDTTLDGIIEALAFVVGFDDIRVVDPEDMTFSIEFGQPLTTLQRTVITNFDIVPKPQGVRFSGFEEITGTWRFGQPEAQFGGSGVQFGRYIGG
jgi:hypothetical protein